MLEHHLTALRGKRGQLHERFASLAQTSDRSLSDGQKVAMFAAIQAEETDLAAKIRATRLELVSHRAEHAERVEQALRPTRVEAAARILDALAAIEADIAALNACSSEIRKASGDSPSMRMPDGIEHVHSVCARIVR